MPRVLMVIDGSSLMHRAFYALPLLTTSNGQYSNAVYGFATMLTKLLAEFKPEAMVVAFDKSRVTFRNKVYKDYKAQRKPTPRELSEQFPLVYELLDAFGITVLEQDGYEADDIIGTLAVSACKEDYEVLIVTGDKDALQLINKHTKVLLTRKGITEMDIYDEAAFHDKYGVQPRQLIDIKGLMGDSSDNIPGVPGVGEKTTCKLIDQFGTVENLLQNIALVSGNKLKEKLRDNSQLATLSKQLATICLEVPLTVDFADMAITPDSNKMRAFLIKMEFKSLLAKLEGVTENGDQGQAAQMPVPELKGVNTLPEIISVVNEITAAAKMYFYPSLSGEVPAVTLEGLAVSLSNKTVYISRDCAGWEKVLALFTNDNIVKITHDAKPIYHALFSLNRDLSGMIFDTLIAEYLLNPTASAYQLTDLSPKYLQQTVNFTNKEGKIAAAWSANLLSALYPVMKEKLEVLGLAALYYRVELPLVKVLARMEWYGITVDLNHLHAMNQEITSRVNELLQDIYRVAGESFNVNSPKQLGVILFEKLGLPVIKKTKTGYSTNAEVLEKLKGRHEIIDKLLEYRLLSKLKSTYLDGLAAITKPSGRVHTSFNQAVTVTGRLSSSEPNLQNIPIRTEVGKKIRELFVPGSKWQYIMSADYSQIELRILAHLSEDKNLLEAFTHNQDIHTRTASEVFGVAMDEVTSEMRTRAKAVNFGIVYGISDYGLSRDLDISRAEAAQYIESYFAKYSGVKKCIDQLIVMARQSGIAKTMLGRIRQVPDINSANFNRRSFAERTAMNTPIQGTAADIIKKAMIDVNKALVQEKLNSRLLLQVHDELIFEVTAEEKEKMAQLVKAAMENAVKLKVPLVVEVKFGANWAAAK